jgi:hypothetical protein
VRSFIVQHHSDPAFSGGCAPASRDLGDVGPTTSVL